MSFPLLIEHVEIVVSEVITKIKFMSEKVNDLELGTSVQCYCQRFVQVEERVRAY